MKESPTLGVTGEQVAQIFEAVEDRVSEHRSVQGQKRLLKIGGLVTACTAIATAASVALASFGFKIMGPPAEIAAVRNEVVDVRKSVDSVRVQVAGIIDDRAKYRFENDQRLSKIETKVDFTNYLVCVLVKQKDPTLVPKDCN